MADIPAGPDMLFKVLRDSRVFGADIDDAGNDMPGLEMASQEYARVCEAVSRRVRKTRKASKGSITIKLEVTGHPDHQSVSCEHVVKLGTVVLPRRDPAVLRGWIDDEGNHLGTQPQQAEMPFKAYDGGKADKGEAKKAEKKRGSGVV